MKISIISNDYSNNNIPCEHGLSLFIEFKNKKILIDAGGNGNTFLENAKKMNVDLSKTDFIIITHGHYDHADGLAKFQFNGQKIFAHKNIFKNRYKLLHDEYKFNGINWKINDLKGEKQFVFNEDFSKINDGIYLSGGVRTYKSPKNYFYEKINGNYIPDLIEDEQLIIFEQADGLVVVSGCTHYGIENMTAFLKGKFGDKKVKALFAGLHLGNTSDKEINSVIKTLSMAKIYKKIFAIHCTGEKAGRLIERKLNGKLVSVGDVFEIE